MASWVNRDRRQRVTKIGLGPNRSLRHDRRNTVVTAVYLCVVLFLPWSTLSLVVTAQGSGAEAASRAMVLTDEGKP